MTHHVLDASAAVELVLLTETGRRVAELADAAADFWVPDGIFDVEVSAAIRRLELHGPVSASHASGARHRPSSLRLRTRRVTFVADRAWQLRQKITFPDAFYVARAELLDCPLVTTDMRLFNAPGLPVETIHP